MDEQQIAEFLRQNPAFFEGHPGLLNDLRLPNPHGGQAIALSERQVQSLREENRACKAKLQELLQFAEENDAITGRLHKLTVALLAAATLPELLAALGMGLREGMSVPHVALRIWGGRPYTGDGAERDEFQAVEDAVKEYASSLAHPYCGTVVDARIAAWFGPAADHVKSAAHMPVRDAAGACIGLLALGSEDALRFFPDMGLVYLERLADLTGAALRRFV